MARDGRAVMRALGHERLAVVGHDRGAEDLSAELHAFLTEASAR